MFLSSVPFIRLKNAEHSAKPSAKPRPFIWLMAVAMLFTGVSTSAAPESVHGFAMHGAPKYPDGFEHFDYVNPDAPKGGELSMAATGTFDSFNPFAPKGQSAIGLGFVYETLLAGSKDEAFSVYGHIAKRFTVPEDRSSVTFYIDPRARFHDGKPITAHDVKFTFETLIEKGYPFYRAYYAGVSQVDVIDDLTIKFSFSDSTNRELPLIMGQLNVLPQHIWKDVDFTKPSTEPLLGSGPYRVASFEAGRTIRYERVKDYWAKDLPSAKGKYNFDSVKYDYYRDRDVAMEAFKAGEFTFRPENNSKRWANSYNGPAFDQGLINVKKIPHQQSTGMQSFAFNIRRPVFQSIEVRQALTEMFDFEWTNKQLFYGAYTRSESYFSNSELASRGLPSEAELALLNPYRDQLPESIFTTPFKLSKTDGSGKNRKGLRKALSLMKKAGWTLKDKKLVNAKTGEVFKFEILISDSQKAFERVYLPFIKNLERLGIDVTLRRVDSNQYVERIRKFDFDMTTYTFGQSLSPGNEQRDFWHSESADRDSSRNVIGIKHPVVDALIENIIGAKDREALITASRALDRVLLSKHYLIPNWHIRSYRVAYWDVFNRPEISPKYDLGLDTWWAKDNPKVTQYLQGDKP